MLFSDRRSGAVALAAVLSIVSAAALSACGSSSGKAPSASPSASSGSTTGTVTTKDGVQVSTGFGSTPKVVIPTTAAPTALTQQVITPGTGPVIASGDTIAANYVGETWALKSGKVNEFDSSFARSTPVAFLIGSGNVIPGWDKTLVGKKVGSRVVLSIPPADGYGSSGQSSANISGTDTLVFVIDIIASYKPGLAAAGKVVPNLPTAGFPKITNVPGKEPTILSTAGVVAPKAAKSLLVVTGTGPKIDSKKTLVLEEVQADLKTGKKSQSSWKLAPQAVSASSVLAVATTLTNQSIGSRVVLLIPAIAAQPASSTAAATAATPAEILIVDVVAQF